MFQKLIFYEETHSTQFYGIKEIDRSKYILRFLYEYEQFFIREQILKQATENYDFAQLGS